jgi:hypothetical protein
LFGLQRAPAGIDWRVLETRYDTPHSGSRRYHIIRRLYKAATIHAMGASCWRPTPGTSNYHRNGPNRVMSASLIGRLGSSAFRLSTSTVLVSLAGSCFSAESAPGPFHHGIRERGGSIFGAALASEERQVQADIRSHLIHRPARDIMPPYGGARVFSYRV